MDEVKSEETEDAEAKGTGVVTLGRRQVGGKGRA